MKARRPLDRTLAREFIFGTTEKSTEKAQLDSTDETHQSKAQKSTEKPTEESTEEAQSDSTDETHQSKAQKSTEKKMRSKQTSLGLAREVITQLKKEQTTRITIDLPKSQHLALSSLAKELDTSINILGRTLIERFLEQVSQGTDTNT